MFRCMNHYNREISMRIAIEIAGGNVRLIIRDGLPLPIGFASQLCDIFFTIAVLCYRGPERRIC